MRIEASVEAVDALAEVFRANGATGVAIEPRIRVGPDEEVVVVGETTSVLAYLPQQFETDTWMRRIEEGLWHLSAFDLAPLSPLTSRIVNEQDWANAWKEHFHPVRIGKRILIKPSWRDVDESSRDVVVELDPGMAFGTGLHPTTTMMLEIMESLVVPGNSVFDVGTGSGILSIAAARLGATSVLAVDIDPVACSVAAENVHLNGLNGIVKVEQGSAERGRGTFDIVAANIIATVIAELMPQLAARMHDDSILVASGIIEERAYIVEEAVRTSNLEVVDDVASGDWMCKLIRRKQYQSEH